MIVLTISNGKYLDENSVEQPLPEIYIIPEAGVILGFNSLEEREQYILNIPKIWNKEEYCNSLKQEINNIVASKFIELDYTDFQENASIGDVLNSIETTQWKDEALQVKEWYDNIYSLRDEYLNNVTEETIDNNFINSLPQLNLNGETTEN